MLFLVTIVYLNCDDLWVLLCLFENETRTIHDIQDTDVLWIRTVAC